MQSPVPLPAKPLCIARWILRKVTVGVRNLRHSWNWCFVLSIVEALCD